MPQQKSTHKSHLIRNICLIIASLIILVPIITLTSMRVYYSDFYSTATIEFLLPALNEGIVPQGFTYVENENAFLISGYVNGTEQAKLFVVQTDGAYKELSVTDKSGEKLMSHSGGVSVNGDYVYIAGCDGSCYVLSRNEVFDGNTQTVSTIGSFSTYNNSACCFTDSNYLYIGEYYHPVKFTTYETHCVSTPCGDQNNAVTVAFRFDEAAPLGVCEAPEIALSITSRIQGMCMVEDGVLAMSASSVFQGSQLYFYNFNLTANREKGSIVLGQAEVALYFLDSDSLITTVEILPKSEGITCLGDKLYMIFESASERFKYGSLLDAQYIYSMKIPDFNTVTAK